MLQVVKFVHKDKHSDGLPWLVDTEGPQQKPELTSTRIPSSAVLPHQQVVAIFLHFCLSVLD